MDWKLLRETMRFAKIDTLVAQDGSCRYVVKKMDDGWVWTKTRNGKIINAGLYYYTSLSSALRAAESDQINATTN